MNFQIEERPGLPASPAPDGQQAAFGPRKHFTPTEGNLIHKARRHHVPLVLQMPGGSSIVMRVSDENTFPRACGQYDDPTVPVENSLAFFATLRQAGVPADFTYTLTVRRAWAWRWMTLRCPLGRSCWRIGSECADCSPKMCCPGNRFSVLSFPQPLPQGAGPKVGMRLTGIPEGPQRSAKMPLFEPRRDGPLDPFPSAPSEISDRHCGFVDKY